MFGATRYSPPITTPISAKETKKKKEQQKSNVNIVTDVHNL